MWVEQRVMNAMIAHAFAHRPFETGGVLLGYWLDREVVIRAATQAGPVAVHERKRYVPDSAHDRKRIDAIHRASGRYWTYLGDWHSHPSGGGRPSLRDRRTLRTIADWPAARASTPVMVIVTLDPHNPIGIWAFRRRWMSSCFVQSARLAAYDDDADA